MSPCLKPEDFERYEAGQLDERQQADLHAHLDSCPTCRTAFDRFNATRATMADAGSSEDSRALALALTESDSDDSAVDDGSSPTSRMARHFPKIEGYRILGVLGQGGMGIVYRAVQTKLDRTVALKVLPAIVGTASPQSVKRFRREATAAARLHHTNIVPIYDFGESQDAYFYGMELIAGQPLNKLIALFADKSVATASSTKLDEIFRASVVAPPADGTRPPASHESTEGSFTSVTSSSSGRGKPYYQQVARWMADAADALHYAHGQGIIHRDIKPANLIVSTEGRIMIADFGLAKDVDDESVTMTGALVGTLRYISPEQAMAKRVRVDHRTDIYSLGATMYELLCLQPAFPGADEKAVLGDIIARDPTLPRKIAPTVPAELEVICMKTLEKSADARYHTARALAEDLRNFLHDMPIVAKRPGPAQRIFKFIKRRKAFVTAVTAGVLLIAASWYGVRAHSARIAAETRSKADRISALTESALNFAGYKKWERAEADLEEALRIDPNNVQSLKRLAWLKLIHFDKDPEKAGADSLEEVVRLGRRALQIDPLDTMVLLYKGVASKRLRRYDEAVEAFEASLQIQKDNYAAWANLGATYALKGDLTNAERCLRTGVEIAGLERDEYRAAAWRNLATLELHLKQPEAVQHLAIAIKGNSADVPSWVLKARAQMELKGKIDLEEALDDAKHADKTANNEHAKAKRIRALAHLRNGQFKHAIKHADLAIELGDMPTVNHLIKAIAQARLGNLEDARRQLASASVTWPAAFKQSDVLVTDDNGILWFDSAAELNKLREEADGLIRNVPE